MSTPTAYRVMFTSSLNMNIILTNKNIYALRSYSHFVSDEQAAQFADTLEATLKQGTYFDIDKCPFCGGVFTRQNRLCLLTDDRVVHKKCFWKSVRGGELSHDDTKAYWYHLFPKDAPEFDFSNLDGRDRSREFRYAIQIVSKTTIHLYLIEPGYNIKHHVCLTYDECLGLIHDIRINLEKLSALRKTAIGLCAHCGGMIYADTTHYKLLSGEILHPVCKEPFIQSRASMGACLPIWEIPPQRL